MGTTTTIWLTLLGLLSLISGVILVKRINKTTNDILKDDSEEDLKLYKESNDYKHNIIVSTIISERRLLESENILSLPSGEGVDKAYSAHLNLVSHWASTVAFKDLRAPKYTLSIHTDLNYLSVPRSHYVDGETEHGQTKIEEVLKSLTSNLVILGGPGAGKTTTLKIIAASYLNGNWGFLEERFQGIVLVRLREIDKPEDNFSLIMSILEVFGITVKDSETYHQQQSFLDAILADILEKLNLLILLDGLDELRIGLQGKVLEELQYLTNHFSSTRFVLTSRTGVFNVYIENTDELEVAPLSLQQIQDFVRKWLPDSAEHLLEQLNKSAFIDAAMRPLTLAHLCALYERFGSLPVKPKTVYRKTVNLLLEEWDNQRGIRRLSKYANFEIDRKFEFISHLAFYLTITYKKTFFTEDELKEIYVEICGAHGLPEVESDQVIREIESHTGLLMESGYQKYEFVHKSLQEYLVAEYLIKLPSFPSSEVLIQIPSELAITVAISSSPGMYLCYLLRSIQEVSRLEDGFYNIFLSRLLVEKPDFIIDRYYGEAIMRLYTIAGSIELFNLRYDAKMDNGLLKLIEELPEIDQAMSLLRPYYSVNRDSSWIKSFAPEIFFKRYQGELPNEASIINTERLPFWAILSRKEDVEGLSLPKFLIMKSS